MKPLLKEWNELLEKTRAFQRKMFVDILDSVVDDFELIRSDTNKVVFRCNHRFKDVLVRPRYVAQWDHVKKKARVCCDKNSMRVSIEMHKRFEELFTRKWSEISDKVLCYHSMRL